MKASIILPNFNGKKLLEKNLVKVKERAEGEEIIVVDNNSSDESVDYIKNNFPEVKLVEEIERQGFANSVNLGVDKALGDIIVLLNTDIVPEKGFLNPLKENFDDPDVFAVGCLDKSYEKDKIILRGRGLAKFKRGMLIHSRGEIDKKDTFWVSGGSGAFRKSIWEKLGGMDSLYNPFYYEDIDLSYRAVKSGYKVMFEPRSVVNHYHEEGVIKKSFSGSEIKTIAYRNQFLFVWKNITDPKMLLEHLFWLPYHLGKAVIRLDTPMLKGFFRALLKIPAVCKRRLENKRTYVLSDKELIKG